MKGNHPGQVNSRRIGALERLQLQLKKNSKEVDGKSVPLEEGDIKRITKEIKILEGRITTPEVARSLRSKKKK